MVDNRLRCGVQLRAALGCLLIAGMLALDARAADWPAWRHDSAHSGVSAAELPAELHLQWSWRLPATRPAWPEQEKLRFDRCYQPVVAGGRLLVGSPNDDRLMAVDSRTGQPLWEFRAEGPIRFAPAVWGDHVYFVSDDGHLYCLATDSGQLAWKFRGGPSDRRILGNDRLVSAWPARGAPVVTDDCRVYFAASIWPFMGIFIHCLDARTGEVIWTNDGIGSTYMQQPHNTDAFATIAPQGVLTVSGDRLLVPGGRSIAAGFDRHSGRLGFFELAINGKQGGWEVAAGDKFYVNGGEIFDLATGGSLGLMAGNVVAGPEAIYRYHRGYEAYDLRRAEITTEEKTGRKGEKSTVSKWDLPKLWSFDAPGGNCLIQAGSRLYAGAEQQLVCLQLPELPSLDAPAAPAAEPVQADVKSETETKPAAEAPAPPAPTLLWQQPVEGAPLELLAADDRLYVVTDAGSILCYGADAPAEATSLAAAETPPAVDEGARQRMAQVREASGGPTGYAIVWGLDDESGYLELVRDGSLYVVGIDPDAGRIERLRRSTTVAGWYGAQTSLHVGDLGGFALPPYLASLTVFGAGQVHALIDDPSKISRAFDAVRPYGGALYLPTASTDQAEQLVAAVAAAQLAGARTERRDQAVVVFRDGPLPGAGQWTHEHADAANTRVSLDERVKAPLGLLWFGGPKSDGVLPRHGHGPQPQVVAGRVYMEGVDFLRASDVYTGRLLWQAELPGVGDYFNNMAHQPGANATNTNYVSATDGVYVVYPPGCLRLDPATGQKTAEYRLPGEGQDAQWGYLNVAGDYLIGGANPVVTDERNGKPQLGKGENLAASKRLVVLHRATGEVLWQAEAKYSFRHNAICAGGGRLYAVDLLSKGEIERLKRRGETPELASRLVCFDLASGQVLWTDDQEIFGTWLSYSAEYDVVVEAGRPARDTLGDEPNKMRALAAVDGRELWERDYPGPAMLLGDRVLYTGAACHLLTGEPVERVDPVTGLPVPWTWTRTYGCNTPMASANLLTFRSGAAGYFDLLNDGGTGNFGGFRSGCSNNLVVADGVLNAPDYTRSCTCSYQNQSSLALVHMPEIEQWTTFDLKDGKNLRHLALNLGAPGNRRAPDGRLWLNSYPQATVEFDGPGYFCQHSSRVGGSTVPWVASSGCVGITRLVLDPQIDPPSAEPARFTVRLYFCEPEEIGPGKRIFNVLLQEQEVLHEFDPVAAAGGTHRAIVREFTGVSVTDRLVVAFTAAGAAAADPATLPLLCGFEAIREEAR
ncbi:MAG: PQQ-binding-like beta-propeller repeat protein [Pirellulales bacterium]|nr:PQQ-binding-like beta-propeller repeat protein [Pirellulales bacterium]